MPNASKNKGKSWERDVAKHLSKIYGVNFQRVPNSGAFVGGLNFSRASVLTPEQLLLASGDIILPSFLSHISLECKFYKDFAFESLLTQNTKLNEWLKQASVGNKIPFVVFKINHKGGFVVFPYALKGKLCWQQNFLVYTDDKGTGVYLIVKMEGFFEKNKHELVALDEKNYKMWVEQNALLQNSTQPCSG